jgi:hypothetical protein
MQLVSVRPERDQVFGQVELHGNAVRRQGLPQQDEHVANHRIERHGVARRRLLPGQGEETLHHLVAAFHCLPEDRESLRPRASTPGFLQVVELL